MIREDSALESCRTVGAVVLFVRTTGRWVDPSSLGELLILETDRGGEGRDVSTPPRRREDYLA